eukprot:2124135-Rhodomonas_salina.1
MGSRDGVQNYPGTGVPGYTVYQAMGVLARGPVTPNRNASRKLLCKLLWLIRSVAICVGDRGTVAGSGPLSVVRSNLIAISLALAAGEIPGN